MSIWTEMSSSMKHDPDQSRIDFWIRANGTKGGAVTDTTWIGDLMCVASSVLWAGLTILIANRHFQILDDRLAKHRYLVAETYTVADMSYWAWSRMATFIMGDDAWVKYPNVKRFHDEIAARPAAQVAMTLKDRHPFKAENDEETRRNMFRHLAV